MSLKSALLKVSKLDTITMEKTYKSINETMKMLKEFERQVLMILCFYL